MVIIVLVTGAWAGAWHDGREFWESTTKRCLDIRAHWLRGWRMTQTHSEVGYMGSEFWETVPQRCTEKIICFKELIPMVVETRCTGGFKPLVLAEGRLLEDCPVHGIWDSRLSRPSKSRGMHQTSLKLPQETHTSAYLRFSGLQLISFCST